MPSAGSGPQCDALRANKTPSGLSDHRTSAISTTPLSTSTTAAMSRTERDQKRPPTPVGSRPVNRSAHATRHDPGQPTTVHRNATKHEE
jgi:hypothetical protein